MAAAAAVLCVAAVVSAAAVPAEAQPLQEVFAALCDNATAAEAVTQWALAEAAEATRAVAGEAAALPSCEAVAAGVSWTVAARAPNTGAHRSLDATVHGAHTLLPRCALVYAVARTAFVDVYQSALQNPTARVRVRTDTGAAEQDLEAPSWAAAARPALAVVAPVPRGSRAAALDVHLRYQPPRAGGGYRADTPAVAAAFLYAPCAAAAAPHRAAFRLVPPTPARASLLGDTRVPVADTRHRWFVTPITFACTILGAIAVVLAVRP